MRPAPTIAVLTQVYPPDPASVGQHMADACEEMARRGWRVVVYTSNRGYDDPSVRFPARELRRGVEVRRLPLTSFGKKRIAVRLLGQISLIKQFTARAVFTRNLAGIFITTIPTIASLGALGLHFFRRMPVKYWVMDLNPDQVLAVGGVNPDAIYIKLFHWFNRQVLSQASDVVTLDRFMAQRLRQKCDVTGKLTVMPPWPMDDYLENVPRTENPFVREHDLADKFVFMYSGNHSLVHPLGTLLEATRQVPDLPQVRFLFVGGGLGKKEVEGFIARHQPPNVISLPYQPLEKIKYSLSAADVHVVSMGDAMVGCVHPCKFYGAMSLAKPILLLGPAECHVSDYIDQYKIGWRVSHGDTEGMGRVIREIAATSPAQLAAMGERARAIVETKLSKKILCQQFCDILERGLSPRP